MLTLKTDQNNPDPEVIARAADILKGGGVIAFPTDTVYGLGASFFNDAALERIFALKGRPLSKGLIAMVADVADLSLICSDINDAARLLMARFWPGPLTLVLPGAKAPAAAAVDGAIGVRLPDSALVRELARAFGAPLATTSANFSGRPSAISAETVDAELCALLDLIIDGGPSRLGVESTVVDTTCRPPVVLREGAVARDTIMEALKRDDG